MLQSISVSALLASLLLVQVAGAQDLVPAPDTFHRLESYPHGLQKPFLDKYFSSRFYEYGGNTMVKSDSYIRLTGDRSSQSGWLFSKLPAMPESFQLELDFRIHGESTSLYGDGMALWIVTHKGEGGEVFGSSDRFQGLGVFFDTYKNNRPGKSFPYVMAMMGDGKTPYDNVNDGLKNEIAGCSARNLHNPRDNTHARLTYVKDKFLSLDLDTKSGGGGHRRWTNCFVIPADEAALPSSALFLGFSARTGQLSENHDIHRVQVYSLRNPPSTYQQLLDIDSGKLPSSGDFGTGGGSNSYYNSQRKNYNGKTKKSGSWLWFFFKLIAVVGLAAGIVVAYGRYKTGFRPKRSKNELFGDY